MVQFPRLKRIYAPPASEDGQRILVDRIWPRGISREKAALTAWPRLVAPSDELRKWFGHDPMRWDVFRRRYVAELDANTACVSELRSLLAKEPSTLLFGARDADHNNAVVLADYLRALGPDRDSLG
jgi:uncharacterized protein YeaO (DUF488 family)